MNEKWEVTKWAVLIVAFLVAITVIGWSLMPAQKRIEREVLVQSHQYKEGMNERVAILEATLVEIDAQLTMTADGETRCNLEAQRSATNAQLTAARRNQ